jgi:hypothetical protein
MALQYPLGDREWTVCPVALHVLYCRPAWRGSIVRPNARVSKTREQKCSVGSNPTPSAWRRVGATMRCFLADLI